jgi:hypothetical protein
MSSQRPFSGTVLGYADSVNGPGIMLSGLDCGDSVTQGTKCFVTGIDAVSPLSYWTLTLSAAVVDHISVEAALNFPSMRWIKDPAAGGAGVSSLNGGIGAATIASSDPGIVIGGVGPAVTVGQRVGAEWPQLNIRVYAVDGVNGNDANVGFADATAPGVGPYAIACAAAGLVAKKTIAGLAAIFPRVGNARLVEIVIANGGVNTVGIYADAIGTVISGVIGYANLCVRGTGTQPTAGVVAFDGSAADVTYVGAITAPGMNVAGYNPTAGATQVSIPCQLNGGGAAGFAAEAAATMPLGASIRFDSATTTVALRNVRAKVSRVTATNTLGFDSTLPLPAVPVATDVFYIEQPGISQPSLQVGGCQAGQLGSVNSSLLPSGVCGIASTAASQIQNSTFVITFCWFTSLSRLDSHSNMTALYSHPARGFTMGGGSRCSTSLSTINCTNVDTWMHVVTFASYTAPRLSQVYPGCTFGTGLAYLQLYLSSATPSLGSTSPLSGGVPPRILAGALSVGGGGVFSCGQLEANNPAGPCITINGHNLSLDLSIAGANTSLTGNGSTFALDIQTGIPVPGACSIRLDPANPPAFTGTTAQIGTAGGNTLSWAQAIGTGYGFQDDKGNKFTVQGKQGHLSHRFAGVLFGGAGAVFTYLADNPQQLTNNVNPNNFPSFGFTTDILLVKPNINTMTQVVNVTLYKNGAPTALIAAIPAGSTAMVRSALGNPNQFVSANTINGADGDVYDVRMDAAAADVGNTLACSVCFGNG